MFLLWCPLDPLASYIYIHETSHTCQHPTRPSFAWILPLHHIIFPIIDQWSWSSNVPFYIWKKTLWSFSWMGFNCLKIRTTFDFEEALYFLPLSSQKLLVLIFYQLQKDKQHKYQNLIQRKEYWFLCSQNVIFPGRWRVLTTYTTLVPDTKISKLTIVLFNFPLI